MDLRHLCMSCMKDKGDFEVCPFCGWVEGSPPNEAFHLHPRTVLNNRYVVGVVIGYGGFGVTYLAWDNVLSIPVAIKEFFPNGLINRVPGEKDVVIYSGNRSTQFQLGLERFLEEARNMAKFGKHPNIVNVYDFFEENNTAYIVMEYLKGMSLKTYLTSVGGRMETDIALFMITPVIEALKEIHSKGIIHRDVSPDNIFITDDNRIKLIDFGAARFSFTGKEETLSVILKPGYAPPEQYRSKSRQGAFSDVYAVGATLYRMLTGVLPEESVDRLVEDILKRPSELGVTLPANIEKAVMKSLALKDSLRFQSMQDFENAILNLKTVDYPEVELIKRRKRRALISITAAALLICIGVTALLFSTILKPETRLSDIEIKPVTITVWLPVGTDALSSERNLEALNTAAEELKATASQITVDIVKIPESDYTRLLKESITKGEPPDIFRSEYLDEKDVTLAASLHTLMISLDADSYLFLGSEDYKESFPKEFSVPLGFDVAVLYVNDSLFEVLDIDKPKAGFEPGKIGKLSEDFNKYYKSDKSHISGYYVMDDDIPCFEAAGGKQSEEMQIEDGLYEFASGNLAMLVGDTAQLTDIKAALPGYYSVVPIVSGGYLYGSFKDLWSVSNQSDNNSQYAAMKLLECMLKDYPQDVMHIQHSGGIPLNKTEFGKFIKTNNDLAFIEDYLGSIKMK